MSSTTTYANGYVGKKTKEKEQKNKAGKKGILLEQKLEKSKVKNTELNKTKLKLRKD